MSNRMLPAVKREPHPPGFTLVELLVIVAVIGITSVVGLQSMASFLQEQRLRQAAFELVAYLQSARARAQRENGFCQLQISGTSLAPTTAANNRCAVITRADGTVTPALPSLDLSTVSGLSTLALQGSTANPITFGRAGVLAAGRTGNSPAALPRMLYVRVTSGTSQQRCVFLDLLSIRDGWRNGASGTCTYTSG